VASSLDGHQAFVDALRQSVLEGPGETDPALRHRAAARASGGPPIEAPYDAVAHQIGEAADRATHAQLANVLTCRRISCTRARRAPHPTAAADYHSAPIFEDLQSALAFLEIMKQRPGDLSSGHATASLRTGVAAEGLAGALFNIIRRYANALAFVVPSVEEFDRAADILPKRGYA